MISSIAFINTKGQILIHRNYKDDVLRSEIQDYCAQIIAKKQYRQNPILLLNGVSYINVPYNDLILLATTTINVNCAMAIQFLYHLIFICKAYFGNETSEAEVKKNFSLIYQILDQVMDYGCPQTTDLFVLKNYIIQGGFNDLNQLRYFGCSCSPTGSKPWRPEGIIHKKNLVQIDIIEDVNVLFSANGTILRADVSGIIKLKCLLSGMPQCKLGMNDKLLLEKQSGVMKFHECVKLPQLNKSRSITFIPPDGSFELLSYKITQNINLPFKIMPVYDQVGQNKLVIIVKVKSIFDKNLNANNLVIKVPCPKTADTVTANSLVGRAKYEPENGAIMWTIKKFQGDFSCLLQCEVLLGSSLKDKPWTKPPISLDFSIPMFTASGLRIRFLKVYEKSGYKSSKLHRTLTKAGGYEHRS